MPDSCQAILDRIAELKLDKKLLQDDLKNAPPNQKPGIRELIDQVNADIGEQQKLLEQCRAVHPAPLRPDIGFELATCLDSDTRQRLEERLTEAFSDQNGIAHAGCINGTERIGIWAPSVGQEEGRRLGLEFVNLLREPQESFGQSIGLSFIRRAARADWEARPKAFNDDGEPATDGPVFLTNFSFRLESPNRVVTTTEGFRRFRGILPDADFTATTTDILGTEEGRIHCDTSTHTDVEFDVITFLVELFTGGPFGIVRALFRIGADIWDSSLGPENEQGGVGCSTLALFPQRIELDGGVAFATNYSRIGVFPTFILAGGTLALARRVPGFSVSANLSARRMARSLSS